MLTLWRKGKRLNRRRRKKWPVWQINFCKCFREIFLCHQPLHSAHFHYEQKCRLSKAPVPLWDFLTAARPAPSAPPVGQAGAFLRFSWPRGSGPDGGACVSEIPGLPKEEELRAVRLVPQPCCRASVGGLCDQRSPE